MSHKRYKRVTAFLVGLIGVGVITALAWAVYWLHPVVAVIAGLMIFGGTQTLLWISHRHKLTVDEQEARAYVQAGFMMGGPPEPGINRGVPCSPRPPRQRREAN